MIYTLTTVTMAGCNLWKIRSALADGAILRGIRKHVFHLLHPIKITDTLSEFEVRIVMHAYQTRAQMRTVFIKCFGNG